MEFFGAGAEVGGVVPPGSSFHLGSGSQIVLSMILDERSAGMQAVEVLTFEGVLYGGAAQKYQQFAARG